MTKAFMALDDGDLKTAEPLLAARLAQKSNDVDALGGMGVLRQQQERYSEAENYLVQATRLPGGAAWQSALNDVRYWNLISQSRDAQRAGRSAQARDLVAQAERLNPGQPGAAVALAGFQAGQRIRRCRSRLPQGAGPSPRRPGCLEWLDQRAVPVGSAG